MVATRWPDCLHGVNFAPKTLHSQERMKGRKRRRIKSAYAWEGEAGIWPEPGACYSQLELLQQHRRSLLLLQHKRIADAPFPCSGSLL